MKIISNILNILIFMLLLQSNLYAENEINLVPSVLDPNEAAEIAWNYIVDKGMDIEKYNYYIAGIIFSYKRKEWMIFFDGNVPLGGHFFLYMEDKHDPVIRGVGGA